MKIRVIFFLVSTVLLLNACKKKKSSVPPVTITPWDARYQLEGTLSDATNATYTWPGTYEYSLETISATQSKLISKDLGFAGHLIKVGSSLSYYGTFGLIVNFDPATHKITSITNFHGQPSTSGRSAVLDPSGINAWDPVSKKIRIRYWMDETGVAGHRTSFDETWVYLGQR